MKFFRISPLLSLITVLVVWMFTGCFKNLPDRNVAYFNDFESGSIHNLSVYDHNGKVDTLKIVPFNGGMVFGFFNNNQIDLNLDNLPTHNAIKVEFDLLIHDKWDGDHLRPGTTIPDVWQMKLEGHIIYITTFSNGVYGQSFPINYTGTSTPNPARADAWRTDLPGVCALKSTLNGSSLYKIEYTTAHTAKTLSISCNDALQPYLSYCEKSWSIDNLKITAVNYK